MKNLIRELLKVPAIWLFVDLTLGTASRVFVRLSNAKEQNVDTLKKRAQFEQKCNELFSQLVVLHGPFKGMRYPSKTAFSSEIYPKLLGSYEQELSEAISYIIRQPYTAIVDVGCAEGYYAVGLGMHCKDANVFAFDTNELALASCRTMGEMNNVEIQTSNFCDKSKLLELDLGDRSLIFCDCDGFESELIDRQVAESLKRHDFLIETHDFVRIDMTKIMLDILSQTHDCEVFESVDDVLKAYNYEFPELDNFDLDERRRILAERRPTIMRWIFAKTREHCAKPQSAIETTAAARLLN